VAFSYRLPAADGEYTVRLHFVEPTFTAPRSRLFDIRLQGELVREDFDIAAAAGGRLIATVLEFEAAASGGSGILIELLNDPSFTAIISGIELVTRAPAAPGGDSIDLAASMDGGLTFSPIAAGLGVDRFGRGSFRWTPGAAAGAALIRIRAGSGELRPQDASDAPFTITGAGRDFYVNDASTSGDAFTAALGDNANDGRSPSRPMASLAALIAAYDLGPGDVVHVDTGVYAVLGNIVLGVEDSGVRIEGPAAAVLDRGSSAAGSYVFELRGADDVAIARLSLAGGEHGIAAAAGAGSERIALADNVIFDHASRGVFLAPSNNGARITGNSIRGDAARTLGQYGIYSEAGGATIAENAIAGFSTAGIWSQRLRAAIERNEVSASGRGIWAVSSAGRPEDATVVRGNDVHDNALFGIDAGANVLVLENRVHGQRAPGAAGILARSTEVRDNVVHDNAEGISSAANALAVFGNRVFANAGAGISVFSGSTVEGNVVYSNSIGIHARGAGGRIAGNQVHANTNQGILLSGAGPTPALVISNTVYQPVGGAVRLESAARNVVLRNNILWVLAGFDIFVSADSQIGFDSDWNILHQGAGAEARVGFWSGAPRDSLAEWRAASAEDASSLAVDPLFVDVDGADNLLGFTADGRDGGRDDNFFLDAASPAIDRGDRWNATPLDHFGFPRADDPAVANAGAADYAEADLGSSAFAAAGAARSWRSNSSWFSLDLPFAFPFYDRVYTRVEVSTEGFLHFEGPDRPSSGANTLAELLRNRRIAPLWDELRTSGAGDDIFVDASAAGRVTVRWNATVEATGGDANFAVTLFSDGSIRFDYGAGNAGLSPTIGLSMGNGLALLLASYDGAGDLGGADSLRFALGPGSTDIGAHEFQGSRADVDAPAVDEAAVFEGGTPERPLSQVVIRFSEPLNVIDARAPSNYELRWAGPDGVFDNGDDASLPLAPRYAPGSLLVVIDVLTEGGALPAGRFRLRINGAGTIHDLSGLALDGDGDGAPGGDFSSANAAPVLAAVADRAVDEGEVVRIALSASDAEGGALAYALESGPPGAALDASSGVFSWATAETDGPGVYEVAVRVFDAGEPSLSAALVFTITVREVNRAPVLAAIADVTIDEETPLSFTAAADDDDSPANPLVYTLSGVVPAGASIAAASGLFTWTPSELQGPGAYAITVRVSDGGDPSLSAAATFTVTVREVNRAPVLRSIADRAAAAGTTISFRAGASDPDRPLNALAFRLESAPAGAAIDPESGVFTWTPAPSQIGVHAITVAVSDGGSPPLSDTESFTVTVAAAPADSFQVIAFEADAGGFTARFNRALDPAPLNLYDVQSAPAASDVAVTGPGGAAIAGTLIVSSDGRELRFLKTGAPLAAGRYSVAIRAADGGLRDLAGNLLDGDADGAAGGDYAASFEIAAAVVRVLGVLDLARGPGQDARVPADGAGLPVRLSDGSGVRSAEFTIALDPRLLEVLSVRAGPRLPAGTSVDVAAIAPGALRVRIVSPAALAAGPIDLVVIEARAPETAPYGAAQVIDVGGLLLNGGSLAAIDDDGVHAAVYLGDATGNGGLSALDAQRILRVAVGLDRGFAAHPRVDPVVIADVTGDGSLGALDAARVLQESAGIDRPEIPERPALQAAALAAPVAPVEPTVPVEPVASVEGLALGPASPDAAIAAVPELEVDLAKAAAPLPAANEAPPAADAGDVVVRAEAEAVRLVEPPLEPAARTPALEQVDAEAIPGAAAGRDLEEALDGIDAFEPKGALGKRREPRAWAGG
jgi:parallel beta-helix repeat protein